MKGLFSSVYLVSKVLSAILNVVAIAVFTRLATQYDYGQYLIGFAFGFIAYSLAVQWLLGAHFGQQSRANAGRVAGTAVVMTGLSIFVGLALILVTAGAGILPPDIVIGCAALMVGFAAYFVANEIGRAQLMVLPVTAAAFLRSALTLVFGCLALWRFQSAQALMIAVALAHIAAALPIAVALRRSVWAEGFSWPTRHDYSQLWNYGWPLIIAGGAAAGAASFDRILLERFFGASEVAPYGVTLDLIKQSFTIVGETVAVSYVSLAKSCHGQGKDQQQAVWLRKAFVTNAFLAVFGVAFFLLLGQQLFGVLLGESYQAATPLIPWLAAANACLILRSYYFAQVIYFAKSVRLEVISSVVALIVGVALGLWLIPQYSIAGAAMAFTGAQAASLLTLLVAPSTRKFMPVDLPRLGVVVAAGAVVVVAGRLAMLALPPEPATILNLVLISLVSATFLIHWDMFDAGKIWARLLKLYPSYTPRA